jgi:hypothetical protein
MSGIQELERDNRRTVTDPHGCHGMVVADSGSRNALQSSYHGTTTVENNDESKLNLERKCVPLKFKTSSWCDERKRELQSTEGKFQLNLITPANVLSLLIVCFIRFVAVSL